MTATDVKTAQLHRRLTEALDTETVDALIERPPPDWEKLATKEDLKEFATKTDLREIRADLKEFATKEDLKGFATKEDLKGFATKTDLREVAAELRGEISKLSRTIATSLTGFALAIIALAVGLMMSGAFSSAG